MLLSLLLAISGETILAFFIWIAVAALIYFVLTWGIAKIALPEPFNKIIQVVLVLLVVIFVINALLLFVGKPFIIL